MKILSIDPGAPAGWSVWVSGKIDASGICGGDPDNVEHFVMIQKIIDLAKPDTLAIESQYISKLHKGKGLITLIERRYVWEVICMLRGCKIVHVNPATWQSCFGLKTDKTIKSRSKRKKDFKQQIVKCAEEVMGVEGLEENVSDSVLIAIYAMSNELYQKNPYLPVAPQDDD